MKYSKNTIEHIIHSYSDMWNKMTSNKIGYSQHTSSSSQHIYIVCLKHWCEEQSSKWTHNMVVLQK